MISDFQKQMIEVMEAMEFRKLTYGQKIRHVLCDMRADFNYKLGHSHEPHLTINEGLFFEFCDSNSQKTEFRFLGMIIKKDNTDRPTEDTIKITDAIRRKEMREQLVPYSAPELGF